MANSTTDSPSQNPTGEPESLYGKIDRKSFGDRAFRGKPRDSDVKPYDFKKKKNLFEDEDVDISSKSVKRRRRFEEESVLTSIDEDLGVYQPKSKETQVAYEVMVSLIQNQLGGQPLSIVGCAADEILAVIKDDRLNNHDKKIGIEKRLNRISNEISFRDGSSQLLQ